MLVNICVKKEAYVILVRWTLDLIREYVAEVNILLDN